MSSESFSESEQDEWNQGSYASEDDDFWDHPFPVMGEDAEQDQLISDGGLLRPPGFNQDDQREFLEDDPVRNS